MKTNLPQDGQVAAGVHPGFRTREQHLQVIADKRRLQGESEAYWYWLSYCPLISKQAFRTA